jgi:methyltransferase-like protein
MHFMDIIPSKLSKLVERELGNELLLVSEAGDELHTFNEQSTFIWKLMNGKYSLQDICHRICEEYEIDRLTAENDLIQFVNQLKEKKMITW